MVILVMELDLTKDQVFHFLVLVWSKCINFWSSSSTHIGNKKKDILLLEKGPTQGLKHALNAEKMCSINFTVTKKKFYLSLH